MKFVFFANFLFLLLLTELFSDNSKEMVETFRHLAVQHEGRVKPLDTVARHTLLMLHGSQSLPYGDASLSASQWMAEVLMNSKFAKTLKLIRIENPDLLTMLGKGPFDRGSYSIQELEPYFRDIFNQSSRALKIDQSRRDSFQSSAIMLWKQIATYLSLTNTLWIAEVDNMGDELQVLEEMLKSHKDALGITFDDKTPLTLHWFKQRYQFLSQVAYFNVFFPIANDPEEKWQNIGEVLLYRMDKDVQHPLLKVYPHIISAYRIKDRALLEKYFEQYFSILDRSDPFLRSKIRFEVFYNDLQFFFAGAIIYLLAFLSGLVSEIVTLKPLKKIPVYLLSIGFLIHTIGLMMKMMLEGRPPVTNLYSSAVFVGWGIVCISLALEWIYRNQLSCLAGSVAGSLSLIIAQHLTGNGDTMEVMRAVLDSNFWLSTHVVSITLGYSATLLAGTIAALWIFRGILNRSQGKENSLNAVNLVYGIICFSFLLTTAGTILGGIWADRSWGRFWGWDPKENGALMIILWDALILHAKIGGYVKGPGLMAMAVFGNAVTSLSWFGVNMLGVGLHSYGFMEGAFFNLGLFIVSQLIIMGLAFLPKRS